MCAFAIAMLPILTIFCFPFKHAIVAAVVVASTFKSLKQINIIVTYLLAVEVCRRIRQEDLLVVPLLYRNEYVEGVQDEEVHSNTVIYENTVVHIVC